MSSVLLLPPARRGRFGQRIKRRRSSGKSCDWQFLVFASLTENAYRVVNLCFLELSKPMQPHQKCPSQDTSGGAGGSRTRVQHAPTSTFRAFRLIQPCSLRVDETHNDRCVRGLYPFYACIDPRFRLLRSALTTE
jgi:hypothetical protein